MNKWKQPWDSMLHKILINIERSSSFANFAHAILANPIDEGSIIFKGVLWWINYSASSAGVFFLVRKILLEYDLDSNSKLLEEGKARAAANYFLIISHNIQVAKSFSMMQNVICSLYFHFARNAQIL